MALTRRRTNGYPNQSVTQDNAVSYLDDIDYRQERRRGRGVVFTLMGALVFALLGAGLYAISGWPWQWPASAVSSPPRPAQPPLTAPSPAPPPAPTASAPAAPAQPPAPAPVPPPAPAVQPMPAPPPAQAERPVDAPVIEPPAPPPVVLPAAPPAEPQPPVEPTRAAPPAQPPQQAARLTPEQRAESQRLITRADSILRNTNDIAAARLFLERATQTGDPQAFFRLAETYDPAWLAERSARGVSGDPERARQLYQRAAEGGLPAARGR